MRRWRILLIGCSALQVTIAQAQVDVRPRVLARAGSPLGTETPAFELAAAEQVARAALAKDPGARETITLRSRVSGRFLAVEGERPVASGSGYVFLAERAHAARGREGAKAPRRAVLLFVAGSRQRPAVMARRELELPEAAGHGRRIRPEATLERWSLIEGAGALVLQLRWPEGGEGEGLGDDTSTVYALEGRTFREVLSVVTRTSGTASAPGPGGVEDTFSQETTAEVEILPQRTRGLRDIQITSTSERLSGCWHGNELGPCPPDPSSDGEKRQRHGGTGAQAARTGSDATPPAEERDRQTGEPEVTRTCWTGTVYDSAGCEP